MSVSTWQEPDIAEKTKIYDYYILKNNVVYRVAFVIGISQDTSTKSVRDAIFNSVKVETLGQGTTS